MSSFISPPLPLSLLFPPFPSFSLSPLFIPLSISLPYLSLSTPSLHSLEKKIERRRIFLSQDFDWTIRPRIIKLNDQKKSISFRPPDFSIHVFFQTSLSCLFTRLLQWMYVSFTNASFSYVNLSIPS
jgi:hypothetical protein